jgi:hypothetical protein
MCQLQIFDLSLADFRASASGFTQGSEPWAHLMPYHLGLIPDQTADIGRKAIGLGQGEGWMALACCFL